MLVQRIPDHFGYVVSDIERTVGHWAAQFGAGPFFMFDRVKFDEVLHLGKPCTFVHSCAFGQWGAVMVEIQEIHASDPSTLTELLIPGTLPVPNHVAYVSERPEEDSAALIGDGYKLFLHVKRGEIEARFHDTRRFLGHGVEILCKSKLRDEMTRMLRSAARGWDGNNPLRLLT
jgi:hypothetical protein